MNLLQKWILQTYTPEKWPASSFVLPKYQSHRGLCKPAVENTLESFRAAIKAGSTMCECDVQLSSDLVPVIYHDGDLVRLHEVSKTVADFSAADLWARFHIPSLEQVLTDPAGTPLMNIELKTKRVNDRLAREVSQVITRLRAHQRILFSSFNPVMLWMMQNYLPRVPRALLVSDKPDADNKWYLRDMLLLPLLRLHMLNVEQDMATDAFLQLATKREIPISIWTVDEVARGQQFLQKGAASLITDLAISKFSAHS